MVLLPCSKCCGPCWRCHTKRKTPTVTALSSSFFVDKSEATGLPNGSIFTLDEIIYDGEDQGGEEVRYNFSYTSTSQKDCPSGFPATNIRMQVRIGYLGGTPELPFRMSIEGDDNSSVSIDNLITGDDSCLMVYVKAASSPGENEKALFTGILCDEIINGVPSAGQGTIQFEIDGIDLNNNDPDYQCFDTPPDESGWQPVGKCHPDEESCALSCPPVSFCECDEPNVLGNELTMTFQDVADTGYTPSETENITCTPEQLISQINAMSFNAPFLMWRWQGIPGNVSPPPDGTNFDEAVWGTESNDSSEGLQASAQCLNLGSPSVNNPVRCAIDEELGVSCLQYFEEDQFFGKVEWTPSSVTLSAGGSQAGTDQRICEFSNTGSTLLEFSKLFSQDPFFVTGRWENLNYVGDGSTGPRFKNIRLAEFTADMLLSINGTPPGGRTMPTTTTGPGTELANLLRMIGINAKEKGCSCKSHAKRMDRKARNGAAIISKQYWDGSRLNPKKESCLL